MTGVIIELHTPAEAMNESDEMAFSQPAMFFSLLFLGGLFLCKSLGVFMVGGLALDLFSSSNFSFCLILFVKELTTLRDKLTKCMASSYNDEFILTVPGVPVAYDDRLMWSKEALLCSYYEILCSLYVALCSVLPMIVSEEMCLRRSTATWSDRVYKSFVIGMFVEEITVRV
jgi:hypothetical protein